MSPPMLGARPSTRPTKIAHVVSATTHAVIRRTPHAGHLSLFAASSQSVPALNNVRWAVADVPARAARLASPTTHSSLRGSTTKESRDVGLGHGSDRETAGRWLRRSAARLPWLLVVASFAGLGGDTPGSSDSAAKISAYYDAHEVREMLAAFVLAASAPLFVLFGVALATSLWPGGAARRSLWHGVLAVGSAVAGAGFLIAALLHVALAMTANNSRRLDRRAAGTRRARRELLGRVQRRPRRADARRRRARCSRASGRPCSAGSRSSPASRSIIPFADFVGLIVSGLWIITVSVKQFRASPAV